MNKKFSLRSFFSLRSPRRVFSLAAFGLVLLSISTLFFFTRPGHADLDEPKARDRNITVAVVGLLKRDHLLQRPLDDEISERSLNNFIEALDPFKIYFYASDVQEFQRFKHEIDDDLSGGDVRVAYKIFKRYLTRLDERVAEVDKFLAMNHDYTLDESLEADPDKLSYPINAAEINDRWRKRIKFDLLRERIQDEEDLKKRAQEEKEEQEKKDGKKETAERTTPAYSKRSIWPTFASEFRGDITAWPSG